MLPTSKQELETRGWREIDILLVTGDAYFDHPSHGVAVIGRVLENAGYRVGIIARPDWRSTKDFKRLGRPTLFAGVAAGAVDTQVNNYTAFLAKRRDDAYAPGGKGGGRPDYASLVYANRMREAFPGLPLVLGGLEASLRRFAYFDPLRKTIRRSILVDSRADILVFGPGERQVVEIAHRLGTNRGLSGISGTARLVTKGEASASSVALPSFEEIQNDKTALLRAALIFEQSGRPGCQSTICQPYKEGVVVALPPALQTTEELDSIFALPFCREPHMSYGKPIPALETVRWSVISHRGCPGGCSFCALALHQGRHVVSRSPESILDEIRELSRHDDFKGTISDVGGPTANSYMTKRIKPLVCDRCKRPSCFHPNLCRHIDVSQSHYLDILNRARRLGGVKRVLVASGLRHDVALRSGSFIAEMAKHHTGGHLKVAPEHVDPRVLALMRKPSIEVFEEFERAFFKASGSKTQYLVPYFIAGFPGCNRAQADRVGRWLDKRGQRLEQVQAFMPIAGTVAAAMYASGRDPEGNPIFVADGSERRRQKELLTQKRPRGPNRAKTLPIRKKKKAGKPS